MINYDPPELETDIKLAIKHDIHKIYGMKHTNDIKLKFPVDGFASNMSRNYTRKPEWNNDDRNYRISLKDGYSLIPARYEERMEMRTRIEEKYEQFKDKGINATTMFENLLACEDLSAFNESPDLEFTSLKYHTILVTVLYYHYLRGYKFDDMYFGIIDIKDNNDFFETIFLDIEHEKCFVLRPTSTGLKSYTKLGEPRENFNNVISRCGNTEYIDKEALSNMRRIVSWSTGLQYYDDFCRGSL
jgi:hypothetical protein